MPNDAVVRRPAFLGPLRSFGVAVRPSCVKSQSSDDEEDVSSASVDADPIPFPGLSVAAERARSRGFVEPPRPTEYIGSRAGAIVGGIHTSPMPCSINVKQAGDPVCGRNSRHHIRGSARRRDGKPAAQISRFSRNIVIDVGGLGASAEKQSQQREKVTERTKHGAFLLPNTDKGFLKKESCPNFSSNFPPRFLRSNRALPRVPNVANFLSTQVLQYARRHPRLYSPCAG